MIFFITVLRALAACLITNAHYTGVYPTDLIANGGLIGDILFFAVSGYCLYNIKTNFFKWYGKRLWRVYPPVLIATVVFMCFGAYSLTEQNAFWWYVYPTYYHFVASIIVLYIPYYFIMYFDALKKHLPLVMSVIALAWICVYLFAYDKSYYHIDTVREPMIRFLFLESMLLGAWFRQNDKQLRNQFKARYLVATGVVFVLYFASKLLFSKRQSLAPYQFLNQVIILVLLYFLFRTFAGLDSFLEKMPVWLKKVIGFISAHTLEIYVVQYVLIAKLRPIHHFPLNWLAMTASILLSAYLLHKLCSWIYLGVDQAIAKIQKHRETQRMKS